MTVRPLTPDEHEIRSRQCQHLLDCFFAYAAATETTLEVLMGTAKSILVTTWMNGMADERYEPDAHAEMRRQLREFAEVLVLMAETTTTEELRAMMQIHQAHDNDHKEPS